MNDRTVELSADFIRTLLPTRPRDAHKGTFGHVFVLAGSRGFTGAAKLTAMAAARSGVGLVTLGIPEPLADIAASSLVEPMTLPLPATATETFSLDALQPALAFAADKDAVVLGPGLSQHPETRSFVHAMVRSCPQPMIIDADGLNALYRSTAILASCAGPRVLTPHPGEMARLLDCSIGDVIADREDTVRKFSIPHRCVTVLKGHATLVCDESGGLYVNSTGNSGMATGGAGDVLAGLLGGLLAQGTPPRDAALIAVYLHGLAGDLAAARMTERALIAGDLVDALPDAWRTLEEG